MYRPERARGRLLIRAIALGAVGLMILASSPASGFGRDADGSRMQARKHALGSSSSDSLSPPGDSVDWRYVKLDSEKKIVVTVKSSPASSSVRVVLTSAVGKRLANASSRKGKLRLQRTLSPGLYYISVSSADPVKYTISIR